MQTIKSFLDQSLLVWQSSTAAARFGIILLLTICLGAIVGVGIWSYQPHYVNLASSLDHMKSNELIAVLDQANISYEIKGAGSIIQVDKRNFEKANVLAGSLGIGSQEAQLEIASPWMDPMNQQNVFRRNMERQLANSIRKYTLVNNATVHLSIPEKQPFLRQSHQTTASVVLELVPSRRFGEAQAAAIADLIAHAVPGLRADQVAISDTNGVVYSSDESMGRLTKQEEYRLNREQELSSKAQALLVNFLGVGNSQVEVTADISFPEGKTTSTEYDPEKRVVRTETIDSSQTTGQNPLAAGVAGTGSNVGNSKGRSGNKVVTSKTEVVNNQYELSSMIREDLQRSPVLNLMTVSVLVNSAKLKEEGSEIPDDLKSSIESLIKQAVGFREGTDQLSIEYFDFVDVMPIEEVATSVFPWDQVNTILKNISLGIAALVALFLGLKAIKNLQPAPVSSSPASSVQSERASQVSQLSDMVKENPEVFSKIIAAWASDSDDESDQPTQKKAA